MEDIGLFEVIYNLPQITHYRSDPVPKEVTSYNRSGNKG